MLRITTVTGGEATLRSSRLWPPESDRTALAGSVAVAFTHLGGVVYGSARVVRLSWRPEFDLDWSGRRRQERLRC